VTDGQDRARPQAAAAAAAAGGEWPGWALRGGLCQATCTSPTCSSPTGTGPATSPTSTGSVLVFGPPAASAPEPPLANLSASLGAAALGSLGGSILMHASTLARTSSTAPLCENSPRRAPAQQRGSTTPVCPNPFALINSPVAGGCPQKLGQRVVYVAGTAASASRFALKRAAPVM